MASTRFDVDSPKVQFNAQKNSLLSTYDYQTTKITKAANGKLRATPCTESLTFKTDCKVPRVGCMLVGWGGNNGSTLTASVMANKKKLEWRTKEGVQVCNSKNEVL
jgi:myo-inositol-1-phosphate synthase